LGIVYEPETIDMQSDIAYRWMEPSELDRLGEIDRSERIRTGYAVEAGQLQELDVNWDTPDFFKEGRGEHSLAHQIEFCREHLQAGGCMIGAFHGGKLVGFGLLRMEIRPGVAQLTYLQVSNRYRRRGIATHLTTEIIQTAQGYGAQRIYVSATPSGSAVGFYLSQGFEPVEQPLPELLELEPEDIHMLKELI
jgi:ribosomal protein S18 acetylase RimI-like enzyme